MGRASRKIDIQKDALGQALPPGPLRVHLDDDLEDRRAPEGWFHFLDVPSVQKLLLAGRVLELSLDNDLGTDQEEGYRVIDFLEEQEALWGRHLWPRDGITVHTANSYARQRMRLSLETIEQRHEHLVVEEDLSCPAAQPRFFIRKRRP